MEPNIPYVWAMQQSTVQQSTVQLISLERYYREPRGQGQKPGTQLAPRDPRAPTSYSLLPALNLTFLAT